MKRKIRRKIPDVLTEEERIRLLKVPNKRYPTGIRNLAIMLTMLDCGLRSSEIVNLKMKNINLTTGEIKIVNGKGNVDRILWINGESLEVLKKWIQRKPESEFVFCTLKGAQIKDSYLRIFINRYGKRAGIQKHLHPHLLRHTFGTDLYRRTKNIRLVQESLGHADLSTTMIYTHIVNGELEEGMKGFRTKEKLEKKAIERLKRLEKQQETITEEIKKLKNHIDDSSLFKY